MPATIACLSDETDQFTQPYSGHAVQHTKPYNFPELFVLLLDMCVLSRLSMSQSLARHGESFMKANLRPLIAKELHGWGCLIRQACKGALNHLLCMPIGQLDTGLDDAPSSPL